MTDPDSFDRIVSYFHALARDPFTYKGTTFEPYQRLALSEKCFRSYTCPEGCGACCMRCSLVWDFIPEGIPSEPQIFEVNGHKLQFHVDRQLRNTGRFCHHLTPTGRCGVYTQRPLPCRFELFKFTHVVSKSTARAMVRLPGRNWALTRVDGEKGAKCEIIAYDRALTQTHINDLGIIMRWMDSFNIRHDGRALMNYLISGPHHKSLVIERNPAQREL